jgi:hypothetical protein
VVETKETSKERIELYSDIMQDTKDATPVLTQIE